MYVYVLVHDSLYQDVCCFISQLLYDKLVPFLLYSKPCKIVYKFLEDGTKVRVSKRSGCVVPKPPDLADRKDFKSRSGYIGIIIIVYAARV